MLGAGYLQWKNKDLYACETRYSPPFPLQMQSQTLWNNDHALSSQSTKKAMSKINDSLSLLQTMLVWNLTSNISLIQEG